MSDRPEIKKNRETAAYLHYFNVCIDCIASVFHVASSLLPKGEQPKQRFSASPDVAVNGRIPIAIAAAPTGHHPFQKRHDSYIFADATCLLRQRTLMSTKIFTGGAPLRTRYGAEQANCFSLFSCALCNIH